MVFIFRTISKDGVVHHHTIIQKYNPGEIKYMLETLGIYFTTVKI